MLRTLEMSTGTWITNVKEKLWKNTKFPKQGE